MAGFFIPFFSFLVLTTACVKPQSQEELVMINSTTFFDKNGYEVFVGKIKVWQRGELFLQEAYVVTTESDSRNSVTKHVPWFCRLINIKSEMFYDFYSFSDTSICFKKGKISEIPVNDGTWKFFSDDWLRFQAPPKSLPDTIIESKKFRQILFFQRGNGNDSTKNFSIGLFPYDKKYSILSLEKEFSRNKNWCLEKILDYYYTDSGPVLSAVRENKIIANKLSPHETKIFNALEKYAREHPVK